MEMISSEGLEVIFNFFNNLLKIYCPLHLVIFTAVISFAIIYIYQELTYKVSGCIKNPTLSDKGEYRVQVRNELSGQSVRRGDL